MAPQHDFLNFRPRAEDFPDSSPVNKSPDGFIHNHRKHPMNDTTTSPHPTKATFWNRLARICKDVKDVFYVVTLAVTILTTVAVLTWQRVQVYVYPTWGWGHHDVNYSGNEFHTTSSDGILMAYVWENGAPNVWVYAEVGTNGQVRCSNRGAGSSSVTLAVRKGDEWKITFVPHTAACEIRWFPLVRK